MKLGKIEISWKDNPKTVEERSSTFDYLMYNTGYPLVPRVFPYLMFFLSML